MVFIDLLSFAFLIFLISNHENDAFSTALLKGVKEFETRWIGWAGVNVPDEVGQNALTEALAEKVRAFTAYCDW